MTAPAGSPSLVSLEVIRDAHAGIAPHVHPFDDPRVIGVEPEGAAAMTRPVSAGSPQRLASLDTISDGLAAPFAGTRNLAHCQAFVDDWILVSDGEIVEGMCVVMKRCRLVPIPAGAAAVVSLLADRLTVPPGATIVPITCGRNLDRDRLATLLRRPAYQ